MSAVGGFHDQNIWFDWRDLGRHQVAILFAREVAREENFHSRDLDHQLSGAQNMAGVKCRELIENLRLYLIEGFSVYGREGQVIAYRRFVRGPYRL